MKETAIVPTTETTAELIPEPTADLIEKSFAENTMRNRKLALRKFSHWLRGREISDRMLLASYNFTEFATLAHFLTSPLSAYCHRS